MKISSPFLVKPHSHVRLSHVKTSAHPGYKSADEARDELDKRTEQLAELQQVLYASQQRSVLIVLQGMDTAGKDGTIRHIFSGVNPQGCDVASFKVPTPLELRHDFLWRCHAKVPARGMITIFNRSHYEDVLSPRVHGAIDRKVAHQRMAQINDFERMLSENGTLVLKFFLHISKQEQTERLQSRIDDDEKRWKLEAGDFHERLYWDRYQSAYEDILERTSEKHAPWFVVPANHKWFRNVAISGVLVEAMRSLKLKYPKAQFDPKGIDLSQESPKAAEKQVAERVAASGKSEKKASA